MVSYPLSTAPLHDRAVVRTTVVTPLHLCWSTVRALSHVNAVRIQLLDTERLRPLRLTYVQHEHMHIVLRLSRRLH